MTQALLGNSGLRTVCWCLRSHTQVRSSVRPLLLHRWTWASLGRVWPSVGTALRLTLRLTALNTAACLLSSPAAKLTRASARGSSQCISMTSVLHSSPAPFSFPLLGLCDQACSCQPASLHFCRTLPAQEVCQQGFGEGSRKEL